MVAVASDKLTVSIYKYWNEGKKGKKPLVLPNMSRYNTFNNHAANQTLLMGFLFQ